MNIKPSHVIFAFVILLGLVIAGIGALAFTDRNEPTVEPITPTLTCEPIGAALQPRDENPACRRPAAASAAQ